MMQDERRLLQETHDAAVQTATQMTFLMKDMESMKQRVASLERWHWRMHAIGGSILTIIVFFGDHVRAILGKLQ